jgi:large subunit ribosomal protein L1
MKNEQVTKTLTKMDADTKKRKFKQTIELMINLKGMDLGKADSKIDLKVQVPHSTGRQAGKSLLFGKTDDFVKQTKELFSEVIMEDQISKMKKADIQKLLTYDVLLAEGQAILTVAKYFGQTLAPKGKMPKPAGTNPAQIRDVINNAMTAVHVTNKRGKTVPVMHVVVGKEDMSHEQLSDNIAAVYNTVLNALPGKKQNIRSLYLKKTMGPAIKLEF